MDRISEIVEKRNYNFNLYNSVIKEGVWKIAPPDGSFVSNFAYPIITDKIDELVDALYKNGIECRPLICGSMSEQPFWYERYGKKDLPFAKIIHNNGLYLPNNPYLNASDIVRICSVVNNVI